MLFGIFVFFAVIWVITGTIWGISAALRAVADVTARGSNTWAYVLTAIVGWPGLCVALAHGLVGLQGG